MRMKVRESHVFTDGNVRLFRQRTDIPFQVDNTLCIEVPFSRIGGLPIAYKVAYAKERETAARHPFAWSPEFGYITSRPKICGTAMQIHGLFHLEGLYLIGDLQPVLKSLEAIRMDAISMNGEGFKEAAHIFHVRNAAMLGIEAHDLMFRTCRTFSALVREETNARIRLIEELPRVFEDAISRALAALKSCRLLSQWELLDLLSPIALAADFSFLTGITVTEVRDMIQSRLDMPESPRPQTYDDERDRDRKDSYLADEMNLRFKSVRLNAKARTILG